MLKEAEEGAMFKVGSLYCKHVCLLRDQGFNVEEIKIVGELQEMVERGYVEWCKEVGVPAERLEDKRRFWTLLKWVAERCTRAVR